MKKSRRKFGRVKQTSLKCNWGEIIDVGHDGMRLRCTQRPPHRRSVEIRLNSFQLPGTLRGRRIWSRRVGLLTHEVGMRFDQCDPEVRRQLTAIAGCGGVRRFGATQQAHAA